MPLDRLVKIVSGDDTLNSQSPFGKALKAFLAGMDTKPKVDKEPRGRGPIELTDAQKKMVEELAPRATSTEELATMVFGYPVKRMTYEWRAVHACAKLVYPEGFNINEEPVAEKQWEPPSTLQTLTTVVNGYVPTGDASRKLYVWGQLKVSERRCLGALMGYLRVFGLIHRASQYERQVDRELFLSTFVRWTHDKPDLTQIEVDQMILAAAWTVTIIDIERQIRRVDKIQEEMESGQMVDANGKRIKPGMTEVEMINTIRTKHEQAEKTLGGLMSKLEASRAKRKEEFEARGTTVLNMLEAWQTNPAWREAMIALGEIEKREDNDEVKRLTDMDELMALISGQTMEEAGA